MKKENKVIISREDFESYLEVQHSAKTNMFNYTKVGELSRLSREKIMEIMKSYSELKELYGQI